MKFFFYLLLGLIPISLFSQSDKMNIYLDCQMRCHFTYVKENITFVNYMQDRYQADIYILATRQSTGSGGNEISLRFEGKEKYKNLQDTIVYNVDPDVTDVVYRELLVKNLKLGLLKYLVNSSLANDIEFSVKESDEETQDTIEVDPWNYWVFNIGGNLNFSGEESFESLYLSGRLSGSRVTDQSKFTFSFRYNYDRSKFVLSDDEEFISKITSYWNRFSYVKSISEHWSAGLLANGGSSSFSNTDLEASLKPAIEYNIYPYKESSTRRFSFLYSIGPEYKDYADTTIFNKINETIVRHSLDIEFEQVQKWGALEIDLGFSQYLHDPELYSVFFNPNLEWNIFKGLRIFMGGYVSFVGDRINIAKEDLSDEEILLQIRQLDTDYTYYTYLGFNYRFGSSYNNFVNPRF